MLYFANYTGDADSSIIRETWARLIDQALSKGGIAEACSVLKRVGSHMYPGDGAILPLDTLCLHLERAALVHFSLYAYLSTLCLVCVYGKLVYLINDYLFCLHKKEKKITLFVFMAVRELLGLQLSVFAFVHYTFSDDYLFFFPFKITTLCTGEIRFTG